MCVKYIIKLHFLEKDSRDFEQKKVSNSWQILYGFPKSSRLPIVFPPHVWETKATFFTTHFMFKQTWAWECDCNCKCRNRFTYASNIVIRKEKYNIMFFQPLSTRNLENSSFHVRRDSIVLFSFYLIQFTCVSHFQWVSYIWLMWVMKHWKV